MMDGRWLYYIVLLSSCVVLSCQVNSNRTLSAECAQNNCPNSEMCFNRLSTYDEAETYVCQCKDNKMDYRCQIIGDFVGLTQCFGLGCKEGFFTSPNHPNRYGLNEQQLYLLYIPGTTRIHFTFIGPFEFEARKDYLYIGSGLFFPNFILDTAIGSAEKWNNPEIKRYDGGQREEFFIDSDTAWVYFISDFSNNFRGFNLTWRSETIVANCPENKIATIPADSSKAVVTWDTPSIRSGVPEVNVSYTQSHTSGSEFALGNYDILYEFWDPFGNTARCDFKLNVLDTIPPAIENCPSDFLMIACADTELTVNWTEPFAFDNSNKTTRMTFTINGENGENFEEDIFKLGSNRVIYEFFDETGNVNTCTFTITLQCGGFNTGKNPDIPTWVFFLIAAIAAAVVLLAIGLAAYFKLRGIQAKATADLSFNPEEFTGPKPGAPLEDIPVSNGNGKADKMGMYEIHAYDNQGVV